MKIRIGHRSEFAAHFQTELAQLPVFTVDGRLSADHQRLLDRPELRTLLDYAGLQEGEGMVFSRGEIGVYLTQPEFSKFRNVILKVIDLADA
jgi:hypothetical protein